MSAPLGFWRIRSSRASIEVRLGALVAGPLFETGARKAEVDLPCARLNEAAALYIHTYLAALRVVTTFLGLGPNVAIQRPIPVADAWS